MTLQRGFSVVELMIAMALSLLLGLGIFQVFTSNQESARLTQALVEVQDTGRIALDLVARDIRNAGYWGCAGELSRINSTINEGGQGYDADLHSIGTNNVGIGAQDNVAAGTKIDGYEVVAGTDVLELHSMASDGLSIAKPMNTESAVLFVTDKTGFREGDVLAVNDCESGDVFQVTGFQNQGGGTPGYNLVHNSGVGAPGNSTQKLSRQYGPGSQILRPTYRGYFLNEQGGVKRLMFRNERDSTTVFADNVEDFQLMFGLDSTGDGAADMFVSGTTIEGDAALNYEDALSVDVSIRIASAATDVVEEGIKYTWNGGEALPGTEDQGRLRRVFTTVSTVRSQLP